MNLLETVILGIIQGLTEWLPISSTGHLRVAERLVGLQVPILFDGVLHLGTLLVTLIFFRKDLKELLAALGRRDFKSEGGQLILPIIIGTVPTAVIGLFFGKTIEAVFSQLLPIAGAFFACGIMLYISKTGRERTNGVCLLEAVAIGTAQGIAIIPGVSRSGLTIAVALLLGLKREKAFNFSFLLSVPAIIGALGLTLYEQHAALATAGIEWIELIAGVGVSMVTGYLSLRILRKIVVGRKFYLFAFYCWLFGILLLALSFSGF
ncbi:MAG: undecaprenyl-diphosphate phosphatase [Candidatus Bathyarchaeota archaeon]|nr:undecaprenyl-diphosphate phosphatase [Candidatus Bathyarchaeota archaeon]